MIRGLSEERQIPRAGKLRIGEKTTTTGKSGQTVEIPTKLDHFKFDPVDEGLFPLFRDLYGEAPTVLPVMLPSNDPEEVFPHEYRRWTGGKIHCHGDNEAGFRKNFESNQITEVPCDDACPLRNLGGSYQGEERKQRTCKPEGSLRVILFELPTLGVFEITTSSISSIIRVNSSLELIQKTFWRLTGVPLVLVLQEVMYKTGRAYVFSLDVRVSLKELLATQGGAHGALAAHEGEEAVDEEKAVEAAEGQEEGGVELPEEEKNYRLYLNMAGDLVSRLSEETVQQIFQQQKISALSDVPSSDSGAMHAVYYALLGAQASSAE